jgi:hypothetical protein
MHTVTIEEILSLGDRLDDRRPPLEHYFSPTRREQFEKDYIHYLNTLLLEMKHGHLDLELYLVFVLTFQFIAPLLGIPAEKELVQFYKIMQQKYDVEDVDINLHFSTDHYEAPPGILKSPEADLPGEENDDPEESVTDEAKKNLTTGDRDQGKQAAQYRVKDGYEELVEDGAQGRDKDGNEKPVEDTDIGRGKVDAEGTDPQIISEKEALEAFRNELDATWEGRREVKTSVQKRLKQDGIRAIMKWQQEKDFPELAEAFGRSVVIPSFFSFKDKKLLEFYRNTTEGISYEVAVPDFEL